MAVTDLIRERATSLSAAERRVAEALIADVESVAFGTVASLAGRARTSGATVVRFSNRLGYTGFAELQTAVRRELSGRLRPAGERIRAPRSPDLVTHTLAVEAENVHQTLAQVDRATFERAVHALAARRGRVGVLPGGASHGVARQLADDLAMLRPRVELVWGPAVHVEGTLASFGDGDVVVAIDLPRYDRALLAAAERTHAAGASIVAITDSVLSPLGRVAAASFAVASEGAGPFDSQLGALAVANLLVAGVADRLRSSATERIDRIEAVWHEADALLD